MGREDDTEGRPQTWRWILVMAFHDAARDDQWVFGTAPCLTSAQGSAVMLFEQFDEEEPKALRYGNVHVWSTVEKAAINGVLVGSSDSEGQRVVLGD